MKPDVNASDTRTEADMSTGFEWKGRYVPERFRWTPPSWIRHFISWNMLYRIDGRFSTCWASVVMWKMYGSKESWWPDRMCFENFDYCNKFTPEQQAVAQGD